MTLTAPFDTRTDLAKRAAAMLPLLDRSGPYADEAGELAPEVVEAFHRDGMFQMWVPRALGGSELGPIDSLEVLEITSYGDPSAGWVQMASCLSIGTAAAYLGPHAVAELFVDGGYPVIAGQGTRPGVAHKVEGGYRLTGEWSFGSGLKHGTYIHSLAIIEETGEPRIFVTPVDGADLKQDSWNVLGLRGTGSIDYTITDLFVPEEFCHFAFTRDGSRGDIYRLGIIAIAVVCHSGWAMGVGRRLLDELKTLVEAKKGRAGSIAESDHFQTQFAEAEASFRAAPRSSWSRGVTSRGRSPRVSRSPSARTRSCAWRSAISPRRSSTWPTSCTSPAARPRCAVGRSSAWFVTCTPAPSTSRRARPRGGTAAASWPVSRPACTGSCSIWFPTRPDHVARYAKYVARAV